MQDRFKFRCFYCDDKTMFYYDYFGIPNVEKDECATLMQCTGLKDKNGKLIYEGDIVKFKTKQNLWANGKVVFTESCALFEVRYGIDFNNWELMDKYQFEVIGNIYENPDLLENTD